MRDEDIQLALQMAANSISVEDEPLGAAIASPENSPKPLRKAVALDLNERRKQFR